MNKALRARILRMRGKKSYGLIAEELGVTRNVVAGVLFRQRHPGMRMTGEGRRPCDGNYAAKTRTLGPPAGNKNWTHRKWRNPQRDAATAEAAE